MASTVRLGKDRKDLSPREWNKVTQELIRLSAQCDKSKVKVLKKGTS